MDVSLGARKHVGRFYFTKLLRRIIYRIKVSTLGAYDLFLNSSY
jgi:hypothetical protein